MRLSMKTAYPDDSFKSASGTGDASAGPWEKREKAMPMQRMVKTKEGQLLLISMLNSVVDHMTKNLCSFIYNCFHFGMGGLTKYLRTYKDKFNGFVKSPDAALRCILRHCGVRQVRFIPKYLRALPADLFTKPSIMAKLRLFTSMSNFNFVFQYLLDIQNRFSYTPRSKKYFLFIIT